MWIIVISFFFFWFCCVHDVVYWRTIRFQDSYKYKIWIIEQYWESTKSWAEDKESEKWWSQLGFVSKLKELTHSPNNHNSTIFMDRDVNMKICYAINKRYIIWRLTHIFWRYTPKINLSLFRSLFPKHLLKTLVFNFYSFRSIRVLVTNGVRKYFHSFRC